jgi:hypothetical protein
MYRTFECVCSLIRDSLSAIAPSHHSSNESPNSVRRWCRGWIASTSHRRPVRKSTILNRAPCFIAHLKWLEAESNRRRPTYEIGALPSELSSRDEIS